MVAGWGGVLGLVGLCVVLGMSWAFQPGSAGQPTPVLATIYHPNTTPSTADSKTPALPTALPTARAPSVLPAGSRNAPGPTLLPNQDAAFGYGIQPLLESDPAPAMDQVVDLSLNWVKIDVDWSAIEPDPDTQAWDVLDHAIQAASSRSLKVMVSIASAPAWTRSVTVRGKSGPPDNISQYVDFTNRVIQRYRGSVHAVEIWDRENSDTYWYTAGGLNPAAYLNLLIPTAQAIRQSDPGIIIISGALTPTGRNDGVVAIDDFVYLQQLIDGGLLDYVDCVGVQHSGFNLPPTITAEDAFSGGMPRGTFFAGPYDTSNPVNPHHSWAFVSTIEGAHNLVVAAHKETPLCVTRFGWAASEGYASVPAGFEFARDNSLQEQAANTVKAFALMHDWSFVRLAVLNNLDFSQSGSGDITGDMLFSVIGRDGQARPVFFAVRDMPKPP